MSGLPRRSELVLAVLATAMSVTWAGTSVLAAMGDSAAVGANTFTTSASWGCTGPGSSTLTATADAWIDQTVPAQNMGADPTLFVMSNLATLNRRSLVRFTLPALPAGCTVTASTLRLHNNSPVAGRVIEVYQGDPASPIWTENGVTWANQPGTAGTAVTSTTGMVAGWQQWTITAHVQAHYTGPNNGFVMRDQAEGAPGGLPQNYNSRENGTLRPELIVTWS